MDNFFLKKKWLYQKIKIVFYNTDFFLQANEAKSRSP